MKNSSGFTFVETLVVISVLGLIFPILFTTFFVILRQQLKINRLTEVKRQGDSIVRILEETIKNNAYKIYNDSDTEICDAGGSFPEGTPAYFLDKYNSKFSYKVITVDDINNHEQNLETIYDIPPFPAPTFAFPSGKLNNTRVLIPETFYVISCNRKSPYTAPVISINFLICYKINRSCDSAKPEESVLLEYQTNIKLRSYPTQ